MEASKAVDAYGFIEGHTITQSDVVQAYVQARLGGNVVTWVELPPEWRPQAWAHRHRPVVVLRRALYCHPDAGGALGTALRELRAEVWL